MPPTDPHLIELLKLPAPERAKAAHALLASLDDDRADEDADSAWAEELTRRLRSIEDGSAQLVDRDEVFRRVRERLRAMRASR